MFLWLFPFVDLAKDVSYQIAFKKSIKWRFTSVLQSNGLWIVLVTISIGYNLFFLVQVRRFQARLKYLKQDFENFVNNTENRITTHDSQINEVRTELKTLEVEDLPNSEVLTLPENKK